MIYVIEELVNKNTVEQVASNFRHFLWEYGNQGAPETPMFFGRVLYHEHGNIDIPHDPNIDLIVEAGREFLKKNLHGVKDIVLHRILVNGQLPGMTAAAHIDWQSADMATMVYYVSDSKGGGTEIYNQHGEKDKMIEFKQGRSILFPSMLLHEGIPPDEGWRISLGIMYRLVL